MENKMLRSLMDRRIFDVLDSVSHIRRHSKEMVRLYPVLKTSMEDLAATLKMAAQDIESNLVEEEN